MSIPETIQRAANDYAFQNHGGISMANAYLEGWKRAQRDRRDKAKQQVLEMDDEYTFEKWWKLYAKSRSKDKCIEKWAKMPLADRKKAIEVTPAYVLSTPDIRFRKDPLTWLNQHCWNDEIYVQPAEKLIEADADKFMAYFNEFFKNTDIPKLSKMTDSRKKKLNRIYTYYQSDILDVLKKVRDSSFLNGENGKRTPVTFEEIFSDDMFLKIKEGYYER